jgi:hypothetical protein
MSALTEDALCQWNQQLSRFGASGVSLSRDPPGISRTDLDAAGDCSSHHDGHSANTSTTSDAARETQDEQDNVHMIEEGDDEDDGLYIGATSDDDSTIAFSDIVLPTEDEDPYLKELAAEEEARTLDQSEIDELPMPPLGEYPMRVHVQQEHKVPRPIPLSAHDTVSHAVATKQTELEKLTQKELLECLEKRLRPYMMLPPKLPPIRHRKRPNCLFLNHMGTRLPIGPLPKKRKMAATAIAPTESMTAMSPLKKRTLTVVLPQQGQMPTKMPSEHPTLVTAPPSPQRIVPVIAISAPSLLPKLLTDSLWNDDLIEQSQATPTIDPPLIPFGSPKSVPPSPANKGAVWKTTKGMTEGRNSEPKNLSKATDVRATKIKKKVPMTTKEEDDAKRAEVFKVIKASMTAIPIQVSNARKAGGVVDPPGTPPTYCDSPASATTPKAICKEETSESSISANSSSQNDVRDEDEAVLVGSSGFHEPLSPSRENSFHFSQSQHHDVLSSLSDASYYLHYVDEGCNGYQSHGDFLCGVHTDDYDGDNGRQRHHESEVGGKNAPPASFATLEGPSSSKYQGSKPPRSIPMARPMFLLSPEMDIVSPRARYTYDPLAVTVDGNDLSTSGSSLAPRRPDYLHSSPYKMPPPLSPGYDGSNTFYSNRRASWPNSSFPMEVWLPPSASVGPASASVVTPDAFASVCNRSKLMRAGMPYTNNDMMQLQSHLPYPPLMTVHPSEGYHSPVSHRRTLPIGPLHKQWKDAKVDKINN